MDQSEQNLNPYLHGFSKDEQDRLYQQARFLEQMIYRSVDFPEQSRIIEIGCGVGAQTEILLRRFPTLKIVGLDTSPAQLNRASEFLRASVENRRVTLQCDDATKLPYGDSEFDGAFICWLLEHVPKPLDVLIEAERVLRPGAVLYCTEVLNSSLFVDPYSPAILKYWFELNDHQSNLQGDPFVGAKLGNLLTQAGFRGVETYPVTFHKDNRAPLQRQEFLDYWLSLMMSAAPSLVAAGRVDQELVAVVQREFAALKLDPNAVFFYTAIQAKGIAI